MINRRLHNCNNYIIGSTEPDMYFDEASLLCVPSRNDPRMVFRYEESLVGQLLVLAIFFVIFDYSLPKIREAFDGFYRRHGFYNADRMSHLGYFAPIKVGDLYLDFLSCIRLLSHFIVNLTQSGDGAEVRLGWCFPPFNCGIVYAGGVDAKWSNIALSPWCFDGS